MGPYLMSMTAIDADLVSWLDRAEQFGEAPPTVVDHVNGILKQLFEHMTGQHIITQVEVSELQQQLCDELSDAKEVVHIKNLMAGMMPVTIHFAFSPDGSRSINKIEWHI